MRAKVAFGKQRDCFILLPPELADQLLTSNVESVRYPVQLTWIAGGRQQQLWLTWTGGASDAPATIQLAGEVAAAAGLEVGVDVALTIATRLPPLTRVAIEPNTPDDWEVVQLHAEQLESQLLNQVAVLARGMTFPVFVSPGVTITMHVKETTPNSVGMLADECELVVAPNERVPLPPPRAAPVSIDAPLEVRVIGSPDVPLLTIALHPKLVPEPVANGGVVGVKLLVLQCRVDSSLPVGHVSLHPLMMAQLELAHLSRTTITAVPATRLVPAVESVMMQPADFNPAPPMASAPIATLLNDGKKDQGRTLWRPTAASASTHFSPAVPASEEMRTALLSWAHDLANDCDDDDDDDVAIADGTMVLLRVADDRVCLCGVSIGVAHGYAWLRNQVIPMLEMGSPNVFTMLTKRQRPLPPVWDATVAPALTPVLGYEDTLTEIMAPLRAAVTPALRPVALGLLGGGHVQRSVPGSPGLLICGPHGVGKTHLVDAVCARLCVQEHVRFIPVQCRPLHQQAVSTGELEPVRAELDAAIMTALVHRPAIIVLHDVDSLFPNTTSLAESDPMGSRISSLLAERVVRLWDSVAHANCAPADADSPLGPEFDGVALLATAQDREAIHTLLCRPGYLDRVVSVPSPSPTDRAAMLAHELARHASLGMQASGNERVVELAVSRTEGFVASDVKEAAQRIVHASLQRQLQVFGSADQHSGDVGDDTAVDTAAIRLRRASLVSDGGADDDDIESEAVTAADVIAALDDFTPSNLHGVQLHRSQVRWDQVGGLHDARQVLRETLEYPTKYPELFERAPLRLRSGLLLYGPPGCGKTMLANAVAQECGLNFISVKGPELLSKYIGQSEQSVREVFQKAQSAAPAVLFFDEFDSIAAKRGHDNTGVTDRVVNQFLTHLDGIEALKGVYVLAATSRPDLIDPALLRPGRLDKSVYCGFPDESERLEILNAVAKHSFRLSSDVDLASIAAKTEHYSGADLHALLYEAHLGAVHAVLAGTDAPTSAADASLKLHALQLIDASGDADFADDLIAAVSRRRHDDAQASGQQDRVGASSRREPPVISAALVDQALNSTAPSVSETERRRFERIFNGFASGKSSMSRAGDGDQFRPRVTLA